MNSVDQAVDAVPIADQFGIQRIVFDREARRLQLDSGSWNLPAEFKSSGQPA
jgi:hypothetical protein